MMGPGITISALIFLVVLCVMGKFRMQHTNTTDAVKHHCLVCGMATSLRCSRCGEAYYCSREHSTDDWRRHRPSCHPRTHTGEADLYNTQTNNVKSSKPTLTVDALLFPVDENVPRIIKLPYTIEDDEDHPGQVYHRCQGIGKFVSGPSIKYVKTLGRKGPALNRTLAVFFGDAFLIDGSRPNRCIQCLTGGKMHLLWSGNIVVMRAEEPIYRVERWNNATMEDVIPMVRFFHEYHDSEAY